MFSVFKEAHRGKRVVQSICKMDERAKARNWMQLGAWLIFLFFLNSPLSLSRNSSQRSLSFSLRAWCCLLCRSYISGMRLRPPPPPILVRHSVSIIPFAGSCSHDLLHLLIEPGLQFYAKILGLMLIFSEFPCQEIPQTLVIPHT